MRARILTLVALLLLAGCSSVPSFPYKIEVQQGNVITQEMVDKLKPGMTRAQVRFALGSPMISDAFHENRWDYIYRLEQAGKLVEQRNLTVFFEDDKLVRIGGSFSMAAFNRPTMQHIEPSRQAGALPSEPVEPESTAPLPAEGKSCCGCRHCPGCGPQQYFGFQQCFGQCFSSTSAQKVESQGGPIPSNGPGR